ncbi:MAG: GPI inositol-deacylase [Blastocatellia bacterium]|nr:GPI inositol-deacylase [Blastocatellia bacterium]
MDPEEITEYDHGAPSPLLLAMEMRASWEWGAGILSLPFLQTAPKGDGHPVLVFPGLGAGDYTTVPLRRYLKRLGYTPHPWNFGVNLGPRHGILRGCLEHLRELHEFHNRRVSLIGWSLGGIYARELAKILPDAVRLVVTLGTPFTGNPKANHAWRFYQFVSGHQIGENNLHRRLGAAPPVPTTSIFSRSDGIVHWKCSLEKPGPITENIEVRASHLGMGVNPAAMYAIADRLAQPEENWQPFERYGVRRLIYADPYRHQRGPRKPVEVE